MARRRSSRGGKVAVYAGSFDPVTRGHLDIIERAGELFDTLVVAVAVNPAKAGLFTPSERVDLLREELGGRSRVVVRAFEGLVVRLAAQVGARWLVRGIRTEADAAQELPMALSNRRCGGVEIETIFIPSRPELAFISSRLVRDIARWGGDLRPFVTPGVARRLKALPWGRR